MKAHEINLKRARQLSTELDMFLREYDQNEDALIGEQDADTIKHHEQRMQYMKQGINLIAKELYSMTEDVDVERFEPFEG